MKIPDTDEIRRRLKTGEYLVTPDKPTNQMSQEEALLWEKANLEARLRVTDDDKRRPGLLYRIQEIEAEFRKKAAVKKYQEVIEGPFENESEENLDEEIEEEHSFESAEFENEREVPEKDPDIAEQVVAIEKEVEAVTKEIEKDTLFNE